MTKQSANRHNKQRQGSSKPVNNASSTRPQTSVKPAQPSANVGSLKRAQQRKQQKTKSRSEQQRIDARNTRVTVLMIATVLVLVGSLITVLIIRNNAATDPLALAETIVDPNYQPVDGV